MSTPIAAAHFTAALLALLDEAFDNVHGYFLDQGTSLFETLTTISASEASMPGGGSCATLAAQVKHIAFYLDVLEESVRTQTFTPQDWGEIWRTTGAVTDQAWAGLQDDLRDSYQRIQALIKDTDAWSSERVIGGAMATVVHTAYHLGEIRQALCTLQSAAA